MGAVVMQPTTHTTALALRIAARAHASVRPPDAEWYTREWPLLDVAWPSVREVTMRYAWIALLLLLAGWAGYLPPAAGHPAPSTFD
jgi:hypothetical protein